jgi:hypothetical protein
MEAGDFVYLHTHSHFSLLEALPKPKALVKRAKELGMKALAMTDNGSMYGAVDFFKACKEAEMERGFVRTAAWHPWTFSTENAAPVMKAEPVLRAEITVIRPFIDETDGGASWGESGPEDDAGWLPEDGRIRILSGFLPDDPDPDLNTAGGRMTRAMEIVRRGESLHRTIYVQNPGLLPGPVWDHLPRERGDTVNGWRHFAPAVQAAYKATWRCARAWAGMPYKTRKLPLAVEAWRMDALRNVADLYRDGAVEHPMFQE